MTAAEVLQLTPGDRRAITTIEDALLYAREHGDQRPPLAVVATALDELGVALPERRTPTISLEQARDEWLRRVRSANRSASAFIGYRIALDDLLDYLERSNRMDAAFREETIVAYLDDYRRRSRPADATYYRRFTLLRRFFRWLSRRANVPDPFADLEPPGKPQQEADWLTPEEFSRLLAAASSPSRRRLSMAERDRLILLTLVATGLRRSELLDLNWSDLDLDSDRPSLLVRLGKGGKPRRQPLVPALAEELVKRRVALTPGAGDPVFCGAQGKRLQRSILGVIIRDAAERAAIDKRVTAHTLRHTAATWLRQNTGDARLVAAYLGHADLSTVSRYAHVAPAELHSAADAIAATGGLGEAFGSAGSDRAKRLGAINAAMAGSGDPDAAFAAIVKELHGFSAGGLTAEIKTNQDMGQGSLKLIGTVYDSDGYEVGRFSRDLLVIGERWRAFHMAFELEPNARGGPFRDAFFRRAEDAYRKYGIDDIRVSAEKIGGYLWAKEGFRFCGDEQAQRDAEVDLWRSRGRALAKAAVQSAHLPGSVLAELEATFKGIADGTRAALEPHELAELGKQHTWLSDGHTVWIGKQLLIDWNWNGIKDL